MKKYALILAGLEIAVHLFLFFYILSSRGSSA